MVNSKAFIVAGVVIFYIVLGLILSEVGLDYSGLEDFNETTPDLPENEAQVVLGFWDILFGIFTFELSTEYYVPFWITILLWIPLIVMVILIYELIRGV